MAVWVLSTPERQLLQRSRVPRGPDSQRPDVIESGERPESVLARLPAWAEDADSLPSLGGTLSRLVPPAVVGHCDVLHFHRDAVIACQLVGSRLYRIGIPLRVGRIDLLHPGQSDRSEAERGDS